jgi:murein DD-endopeptidase MepM/ murein hydrolase activator NlpD
MRRLAVLVVAAIALVAGASRPALADGPGVTYRPPVEGPLTDRFRPPADRYGAGNLGIDYATAPGTDVKAAAAGEVVFAGPVGSTLHVVVLHADGVRTTYSFLATVSVHRGQAVAAGAPVGTSVTGVHFGARVGEAYVDPAVLLGSGPPRVHLVPDALKRPAPDAEERSNLEKMLGILGGAARSTAAVAASTAAVGVEAVDWARDGAAAGGRLAVAAADGTMRYLATSAQERLDQLRLIVHYATVLAQPLWLEEMAAVRAARREWERDRRRCTPATDPTPVLHRRHIVVQVAGLGSGQSPAQATTAEGGAAFAVDTIALGYLPADTHHFSYRGGTTAVRGYDAGDTQVDIRDSGRRLRELLERLQYDHPGVTIDLIAHSQGGLVVRSALAEGVDRLDPRSPHIGTVVTLATPHHGANAATAGALLGHTRIGDAAQAAAGVVNGGGIDPRSTSVRQLAETSSFIRELDDVSVPEGVRFVSIAARGDLVVPSPSAHLDGATNVIVDVTGALTDHDHLPRGAVGQREIALAVTGRGPGCETWADARRDALEGVRISRAEDTVAAGLGLAATAVDVTVRVPRVP